MSASTPPTLATLFTLTGRVALVTGGARGIGAAIAARFAEAGADVALLDSDGEAAQATARTIAARTGRRVIAVTADVADTAALRIAVDQAATVLGRLDICVANAGVYPFAAAIAVDEAIWDRTQDVTLKGAFFTAQAAARQMMTQGQGGRILMLGSTSATRPSGNLAHYDAAKAGVRMLARSLALEWARYAITVNVIAPGEIDTPGTRANSADLVQVGGATLVDMHDPAFLARIPLGRLGTADDVARAAVFLASDAASYITGATLTVDGGFLLT